MSYLTYLNLQSHLKFFQQIFRIKGGNTLSHEESKPITSGQGSWNETWHLPAAPPPKKNCKNKAKTNMSSSLKSKAFGTGEQSPLPDLKSNLIIFSKHKTSM